MPLNRVWFLPLWVWNRVYKSAFLSGTGYTFCHSNSGTRSGLLFCCQNRAANKRWCCCRSGPAARLLFIWCVRFEGRWRLTFFSLEQGIYFQDFIWNNVAKLCLFSLEQGQVPRHSVAHPHLNLTFLSLEQGIYFQDFIWNNLAKLCLFSLEQGQVPRHSVAHPHLNLTFFSLEQGIYFQDFIWNNVAKLCLFSLEQGQVPRHSVAHPHLNLTFFSLEQGIYFQDFIWNNVAKLCLFSLEQGQVPRHSVAHPHLNLTFFSLDLDEAILQGYFTHFDSPNVGNWTVFLIRTVNSLISMSGTPGLTCGNKNIDCMEKAISEDFPANPPFRGR